MGSITPKMHSFILFCLVGVALSFTIEKELKQDKGWQVWKARYNKSYADNGEENVRHAIWKDNFRRITEFNQKSTNLFLTMNAFGDLTNTEYRAAKLGFFTNRSNSTGGSTFLAPSHLILPNKVDWRKNGLVTGVKNQGQCGSCWAFSTTGSLEGQHRKKTGKLVSFSEQNLIDCSDKQGNHGCEGGLMDYAFTYIKENGRIGTESSYPYTGKDDRCVFESGNVGSKVIGFTDVTSGDEKALQEAVASVGPISVAIDASHFSFQFYSSGVYNEVQCSSTQLDHAVLAVGYGVDDRKDYWLVKNSWGTDWGLRGYIRMSRNKDNQCGIATSASYPQVQLHVDWMKRGRKKKQKKKNRNYNKKKKKMKKTKKKKNVKPPDHIMRIVGGGSADDSGNIKAPTTSAKPAEIEKPCVGSQCGCNGNCWRYCTGWKWCYTTRQLSLENAKVKCSKSTDCSKTWVCGGHCAVFL